MNKLIKKIIAIEGLIFLSYFIIVSFFCYQSALEGYPFKELICGIFWGRLLLWLFIYASIRFIIWAIKTLREDMQVKGAEKKALPKDKALITIKIIGWLLIMVGIISIVTIILPIICVPIGIGILKLKEKSRIHCILFQEFQIFLSVVITIIALFMQYTPLILLGLINGIVAWIIIRYLNKEYIKSQFIRTD